MIQATHKDVEIELQSHQLPRGFWKCDYTLITHPQRIRTSHRGDSEFPTKDLADEQALQEARAAIDRDTQEQPEEQLANPPKQVRI